MHVLRATNSLILENRSMSLMCLCLNASGVAWEICPESHERCPEESPDCPEGCSRQYDRSPVGMGRFLGGSPTTQPKPDSVSISSTTSSSSSLGIPMSSPSGISTLSRSKPSHGKPCSFSGSSTAVSPMAMSRS
eukprot:scaffold138722_cov20-Prasinocladus_malaysianus.AAC.1